MLGALPRALAETGEVSSFVVSARYGSINAGPAAGSGMGEYGLARRLRTVNVPVGNQNFEVRLYEGRLPGSGAAVPIYLIEHPLFSDRPGLYGPPERPEQDYPDNPLRFALLSKAALRIAEEFGLKPDIVHSHDWSTALAPYYTRRGALSQRAATVFTVHNLLFKGLFPLAEAAACGVAPEDLGPSGVEFWGQAAFIKAGLQFAHRVTTVSPHYATEIRSAEFGYGLEGVMQSLGDRLTGILNGCDYERWSPWIDPYLPARYGMDPRKSDALDDEAWLATLSGKARCKADLQRELGLPPRPRTPLFATISRLTDQKGIDLICAALENDLLQGIDMQYVIIGRGDAALEVRLKALGNRYPGRLAVRITFDEALSHRTEAGADFFVMPSRFEPCGLNQMYSMRYGTLPIVRAVGGLADSVVDFDARSRSGTGFTFSAYEPAALVHTIRRAVRSYSGDDVAFAALIRRAMRADFSWAQSARAYLHVYKQALRDVESEDKGS